MAAQQTFSLTFDNASLVATVEGGGAIVEAGAIFYEEGRYPDFPVDEPNEPTSLQYFAIFERPDVDDADASVAVQARIVINGTTNLGPTEIRGNGWIGYDDKGNVEGRFNDVPVILIDRALTLPPIDRDATLGDEAYEKYARAVAPRPSAQFTRATRGRSMDDVQ